MSAISRLLQASCAVVILWIPVSCDTVQPEVTGAIVAQMFVEPERPAPPLRLHRTAAFGDPGSGITGATATLSIGERRIRYTESSPAGWYVPDDAVTLLEAFSTFRLHVQTDERSFDIDGTIPPRIRDTAVRLDIPERAVRAVLLDSLSLPLDSLRLSLPSQTGYLYPVVATLSWEAPDRDVDDDWWMETRLVPVRPFTSALIDYFLKPEGLAEERTLSPDADGRLSWSGVYAVPVSGPDDALPAHDLRIVLIRGSSTWAAFASSDGDPAHREPTSNVPGGVGIVAGISVDTLRISLE